ncbi:hypothetical protein [Bartonella raoultii]|uniref:Uncharacterized protein n=1 Tax=Bartonella raoultii TaxID=1457020 RepID=A0ABS7IAN1_9HYPH|nr:hypothetical protein [Bartonella raoultii]MBX4336487.1 hypothetical protein [Bartonella raoultii]
MNIRYFFIAGAVTSGLSLALQESDRIVSQKPSPVVTPYTVETITPWFIQPISDTTDINILKLQRNKEEKQREIEDLYKKGKNLLHDIIGFFKSFMLLFLKYF